MKLIVVAGQEPWTGIVYTTRGSARHKYHDQVELLKLIGQLTGWRECLSPSAVPCPHGQSEG